MMILIVVQNALCEDEKWLIPGKCRNIWRPEKLQGRCFGLKNYNEFSEVAHIKSIDTPEQCRALCCNLDEKCVTYQYQKANKECKVGGPVRLGLESAATVDWCEPKAPQTWQGKKLNEKKNGVCTWGQSLPYQCFGLGPEQKLNDKTMTSANDCESECCKNSECEMFQFMEGRGCFYAKKDGVWCEETLQQPYIGERKCVKGFCGGKESEYLKA